MLVEGKAYSEDMSKVSACIMRPFGRRWHQDHMEVVQAYVHNETEPRRLLGPFHGEEIPLV